MNIHNHLNSLLDGKLGSLAKEIAEEKLKEKLNKRLLPIKVLEGKIEDEIITFENKEVGKVIINNKYPFGLIKTNNENFSFEKIYQCGEAKIQVIKPSWL